MIDYLLLVVGTALALVGILAIVRPPHRPWLGSLCVVVASVILLTGFWSASTIGSDGDGPVSSGPTATATRP